MPYLHRVEYFYPLAMGISTMILKIRKIFCREGPLVQQLPSVTESSFIFKKAPVNISPEVERVR